ncbi:unnamed protein product [Effrenium voratum]|nr:unnamed protein product [Effrenium voratum]
MGFLALCLALCFWSSSGSSGCGVFRRCGRLEPGDWLAPGEWLTSPSERFVAVLIAEQLQVLDAASLKIRWASVSLASELTAARVVQGQLQLEGTAASKKQRLQHKRSATVRFTVTKTRGGRLGGAPQGVQLGEFLLWRQGKAIQPLARASCPDGVGPPYQGPRNAVDGNVNTKWWVASEPNVTLVLDFPDIPAEGPFLFGFSTGDDMPSRDPVQWILEASVDGTSWVELHRQDTTFATPLARHSMTQLFDLSPRWRQLNFATFVAPTQPYALVLSDMGSLSLAPAEPAEPGGGILSGAGPPRAGAGLAIC